MWDPTLLLLLLLLLSLSRTSAGLAQPLPLRGLLLDCGAAAPLVIDGLTYLPDGPFISTVRSSPLNLSIPGLLPALSTLRSFPLDPSRRRSKFCYAVPVVRKARYLVRTTYFYGRDQPPVFDQMVDGTFWTIVNTTADYNRGAASFYEAVFPSRGKTMSVCLAGNGYTDADPFISSLELILLEDSVYNSTDFGKYAMGLIARNNFGSVDAVIRYPYDIFDRSWQPFTVRELGTSSNQNRLVSGLWNIPPAYVFKTALTTDKDNSLELQWPPLSLPSSSYYIALYFAGTSIDDSSRTFSVFINGYSFYNNLKVTSSGLAVFATQWNLSGLTNITLIPDSDSVLPPLINAGEVFGLFPLGGITVTRDVIALDKMKKSIDGLPLDWNGDPCLPNEYSWTGVTCSEGPKIRVIALNLSSMGLSGSLPPSIANLTALTDISFENNVLTGPIPDLTRLKRLQNLHLQDNQLSGTIPPSLGNLTNLKELFLENNNLTGAVPVNLRNKPGLNIRLSPGNRLS